MYRQLSLKYYKTDNGWLIEYTGSGTTPVTSDYVFAEWEDTAKKLVEILNDSIGGDYLLVKKIS